MISSEPIRDRAQANAILRNAGYDGVQVDKVEGNWYFVGRIEALDLNMTDLEETCLYIASLSQISGRDLLSTLGKLIDEEMKWR